MISRRGFLVLLTVLVTSPVWGQDFVYILPSKEIAETGEDLWFKAYLMDRQSFALSDRSQTLYFQVRSEKDSLVWSEKYPLVDGRGEGHVYIGDDWPLGEYFLEGYARSSFTIDSTQAIRPRRIRVVDRVTQMDSITAQSVKDVSIQKAGTKHRFDLFPEGGSLIEGVSSVVAFKATYGDGFPEEVSGKVLEDGQQIAEILCLHDGMGQFIVTPRQGKNYRVVLDDGREFPLPDVEQDGMALRVIRNNLAGITLLVSAPDSTARTFSILAKQQGILCGSASGTVSGQQAVRLPKEFFPFQGIVEITLADGTGHPVAERLVFVNPGQRLSITASTDQERYARRAEGKVRLQVTDAAGQPITAELAISIFDKAYLYLPGHENILSHCFLSEQIRGSIFNPTYYFDEQNEDRFQALDLLLMTQGWRRYVWDQDPAAGRPLLTDGVSGIETTGRELANKMQLIQAFSPQSDTCLVMTDDVGNFEIDPSLMDRMRGNIYLKPMLSEKYKAKLAIVNPFDSINVYRLDKGKYLSQNHIFETRYGERVISDADGTIVLDEALISAKRLSPYRDKVTGYLDSLAILASGEWVCECNGSRAHRYLNDYNGYSHHPEGCPGTTYTGKRLMPKRGETYELIKYEPAGGNGDWIVTDIKTITYTGPQYSEEELLQMYGMWKAQGYYPRREFYEPDTIELSSAMPDPRNLLQWKPAVLTDENGVAEVPFTTSDVNTEFVGVVEAIDGTGLMGCQTFTFRVIKSM